MMTSSEHSPPAEPASNSGAKTLVEFLPLLMLWACVPGYVYNNHYYSALGVQSRFIEFDRAAILGRTLALVSEPKWGLIATGACSILVFIRARKSFALSAIIWIVTAIVLYWAASFVAVRDAALDMSGRTSLRPVEFDLKTCPDRLRPPAWRSGGCHASGRLIMKNKDELYVFAAEGADAHINFSRVYIFKSDGVDTFQTVNP